MGNQISNPMLASKVFFNRLLRRDKFEVPYIKISIDGHWLYVWPNVLYEIYMANPSSPPEDIIYGITKCPNNVDSNGALDDSIPPPCRGLHLPLHICISISHALGTNLSTNPFNSGLTRSGIQFDYSHWDGKTPYKMWYHRDNHFKRDLTVGMPATAVGAFVKTTFNCSGTLVVKIPEREKPVLLEVRGVEETIKDLVAWSEWQEIRKHSSLNFGGESSTG